MASACVLLARAIILMLDGAGKVIERTSENQFQKWIVALTFFSGASTATSGMPEGVPLPSVLAELLAQPAAESTASRNSTTLILTGVLLNSRGRFSSADKARGEPGKLGLNNIRDAFRSQGFEIDVI
jgi:hypothetical protein